MRACAVALAVLLLCVAVTAMPPVKRLIRTAGVRGTARTAAQINPLLTPTGSNSSLRAGAAKINGTLPVGVPLAGYNHGQRRAARYPLPKFTQYTTWMAPRYARRPYLHLSHPDQRRRHGPHLGSRCRDRGRRRVFRRGDD